MHFELPLCPGIPHYLQGLYRYFLQTVASCIPLIALFLRSSSPSLPTLCPCLPPGEVQRLDASSWFEQCPGLSSVAPVGYDSGRTHKQVSGLSAGRMRSVGPGPGWSAYRSSCPITAAGTTPVEAAYSTPTGCLQLLTASITKSTWGTPEREVCRVLLMERDIPQGLCPGTLWSSGATW